MGLPQWFSPQGIAKIKIFKIVKNTTRKSFGVAHDRDPPRAANSNLNSKKLGYFAEFDFEVELEKVIFLNYLKTILVY